MENASIESTQKILKLVSLLFYFKRHSDKLEIKIYYQQRGVQVFKKHSARNCS